MKLDANSIKQILVRFGVAKADDSTELIKRLLQIRPSPTTTGFSFIFSNRPMWLIFDEDADDNFKHLAGLTGIDLTNLKLHPNPRHPESHGLPILSKTVYLLEQINLKQRLDQRLQQLYPDQSRSKLQKHIKSGAVMVDGEVIQSPSYLVDEEDIELSVAEIVKKPQDFQILYEDDDVLAINKPSGVLSHARPDQDQEWTVEDFAREHSQIKTGPILAHRLDRLTSGILLAAKNPESLASLKNQFKNRQIQKTYLAVVDGSLPHQAALIDLPLARSIKNPQRFQVDAGGRSAQTKYQIIKNSGRYNMVQLNPTTGRTHQLRVHMAHLGAPIVGDPLYGNNQKSAKRMMLHASQITFTNRKNQSITVDCPTPSEFQL